MAKDTQKSPVYFIHGLEVRKLWGYRDLGLTFNKDINVIIGPNASGKTTILNLLRYILTVDLPSLFELTFDEVFIHLKSFNGRYARTVKVTSTESGLGFKVSGRRFDVKRELIVPRYISIRRRPFLAQPEIRELVEILKELVPAVWLPVSRRLPIPEEEEEEEYREEYRFRRPRGLESVDVRLRELLAELVVYRLGLEGKLSERYKEFEDKVLQVILYSKQHDAVPTLRVAPPTDDEKKQLLRAFEVAGLLDDQTKRSIDEHFSALEEAAKRINKYLTTKKGAITLKDVVVIPLIERTKSMVELSRKLEKDRESLFTPLRRYEAIVNSFLSTKDNIETSKVLRVEDDGKLNIKTSLAEQDLRWPLLSSGEKQILILLTQALLWEDRPVVYVVDEPELSLHVDWQSKFLSSLWELGGQIQIIVATHSPDIVGPFRDKVIDLGSK